MTNLRKILDTFTLKAFGRVLQGENREYHYKQLEQQILELIPKKKEIPPLEGAIEHAKFQIASLPITAISEDRLVNEIIEYGKRIDFNQALSETEHSMTGER
jgi:hypothetical protein